MKYAEVCRLNNEVQLLTGGKKFLTSIFCGEDGVYYDAIGDEFFIATRRGVGTVKGRPAIIYELEFSDGTQIGPVMDHGFNEFLGAL